LTGETPAAMPQVTVDLDDDLYRLLMELVASKPGRTPEDTLLELLIGPLCSYHSLQKNPSQNFMIALTGEETEQVNKLAAHWRATPDEALRRAAVDGLDMAMQIKAHDEAHGSPFRTRKPGMSDLDDDIPI
jgi:hypothetical protein